MSYQQEWYQKNKEKKLQQEKDWYYKNHEYRKKQMREYYQIPVNRDRRKAISKTHRIRAKFTMFEILGSDKCVKCGYSDPRALQIDHIHGGGRKERKLRRSHISMLKFYITRPAYAKQRLQILCANCNQVKKFENHEGVT